MSKELVISASPHETRVAIVEDGQLCEIYIEREKEFALVGSLYKGRVTRVLPGMQSAFVDIGLDSDAFLYVSDFLENLEDYDHVAPQPAKARAPAHVQTPPAGESVAAPSAPSAPSAPAAAAEPEAAGEPSATLPGEQIASHQPGNQQPHSTHPPHEAHQAHDIHQAGAHSLNMSAPDETGTAEPAAANPASTQQGHQPHEHRPNRGQGNFGDRDRDRRGRRWGRRGRGAGRHGRELPSSKYTSSGAPESRTREHHEHQSYEPPADYRPIILPGESLAKYKDRPSAAAPAQAGTSAPAGAPDTGRADFADASHAESAATLPNSLYATPEVEIKAPLEREPLMDARASSTEFTYAQPFADIPPAIGKEPEAQAGDGPLRESSAMDSRAIEEGEEVEEGEEAGSPLSDEEMSALAEQLVDVKHEEAQAGVEEAAEAAMVPFVEEAELEELEDALNEVDSEEEEGEGGSELPIEEMHEETMAASPEESAEIAEGSAEQHPSAELPHGSEPRPVNARISQPPRARFQRPMRRGGRNRRRGGSPQEHRRSFPQQRRPQLISEVLKAGQEIIVQIAKEPLGKKGARITSHVALPGRFLVYMPTVDHIGVSHRIGSAEDRSRLRRVVTEAKGTFPGGFIVRTAAASASDDEIRADAEFLGRTWDSIRNSGEQRHAPALLHRDLNLVERILRDYLSDDYAAIWIDSEEEYGKVLEFVGRFQPRLINRVKLYTKESPIFEEFGIQQELDKALRPKVWLKSGGYIVINHTEALVAIDVNTGKFVGRGSTRLEDTIVRTNLEAVNEIVRQIRLRDLGGIIVVDFIDMEERRNREKVLSALEQALHQDRAPSKALAFNEFGLVCITRKRTKQALERVLCQPCPYCTGSGMVKSIPTICYEIQNEARKMAGELDSRSVTLRVNPEIAKALKTRESLLVDELEQTTRKSVIIQSDPTLHWEQYDIY